MASAAPEIFADASVDGVHFALINLNGRKYRVGAVIDDWAQRVASSADDLHRLAEDGIWIGPETGSSQMNPGVMCCGLGSVWPGMGQELYANFAAARHAMNEIADLADWDVLGLMDETDLSVISRSRWQIPYLFMLEYAQWRQFAAMGLRPGLVCGHSLGELIALCIAGIYDLASAWYVLETRAEHMAELENKDNMAGGMLAVPAGYEEIADILKQWPELRISNRNTYRQFILGGPRNILLEARRSLRHKRIPAVMLNMNLAFHNPAMRILRSLSYRRLTALKMFPPALPTLSCIDARRYPAESRAICRRITDLDENTVDWVQLMDEVKLHYNTHTFLELGPQETLCAISSEINPDWDYIPSDRKGHEAEAMAAACARLFAAGFLKLEDISQRGTTKSCKDNRHYEARPQKENSMELVRNISEKDRQIILHLLAEVSQQRPEDIKPELDLRHDLGLRSVNFPYLMLEAEQRLGKQAELEKLFQLNTVADLLLFLSGADNEDNNVSEDAGNREQFSRDRQPIARFRLDEAGCLVAIRPAAKPENGRNQNLLACFFDPDISPQILVGLEKLGNTITVAGANEKSGKTAIWDKSRKIADELSLASLNSIIESVPADKLLTILPPFGENEEYSEDIISAIMASGPGSTDNIKKILLRRFPSAAQHEACEWLAKHRQENLVFIAWLDDAACHCRNMISASHLLSLDSASQETAVLWKKAPFDPGMSGASKGLFDIFYQDGSETIANFNALCQFSASLFLADHGADAKFTPLLQNNPPGYFTDAAFLPLGNRWELMTEITQTIEPGLAPIGFADWRIQRAVSLPQGITRECRILAHSRLSLWQEEVPAAMCNIKSYIAGLTKTGRKSGSWPGIDEISLILAPENPSINSLWKGPSSLSAPWSEGYLNDFYDISGYGEKWRFIKSVRRAQWPDGARGISCDLDLGKITDNHFKEFSRIIDAVFQASHIAVLLGTNAAALDMVASLLPWRLSSIGFARFDMEAVRNGSRLEICNTWQNDSLIRYDCQLFSENGDVILNINNLEFERVEDKDSSQTSIPEVSS